MNRAAQPIPQTNVTAFGREQQRDMPAGRVIPYEYVADFTLKGDPGNLIQDVINVSVEGVFIATSIGYGLAEERAEKINLVGAPATLGDVTLANLPPDVLIEGFRLNPNLRALISLNGGLNGGLPLDQELRQRLFQRLKPVDNFSFMLSLVDTGTGRELQNKPVNSLATLGRADGRRPFKMLPQPMVFLPRSTIRLQVEERTQGVTGRLFITLQGYKVLGLAGATEEETRRLAEFEPMKKIPVYDHETGDYRIHPLRTRFAFTVGGQLNVVSQDLLGRLFQSVNRPEEVRFLYSINDTGTGRELQNQRVFNVAGLGIANGERPFKVFHKPMTFLPRSSIRVQVEEVFGRGRLFLVFQGYKILR